MTFIDLDNSKEIELADGIRARIVNSESMSVAYVTLDQGAILPEHHHINEQVVNVIEGELELVVDGRTRLLRPGVVEVLPPDIPHSGRAMTYCRVIDVFHPVRADWAAILNA